MQGVGRGQGVRGRLQVNFMVTPLSFGPIVILVLLVFIENKCYSIHMTKDRRARCMKSVVLLELLDRPRDPNVTPCSPGKLNLLQQNTNKTLPWICLCDFAPLHCFTPLSWDG